MTKRKKSPLTPRQLVALAKKGEAQVVFLGDSITEAGAGPDGYVTLAGKSLAERAPGTTVVGAGISGNRVPDLLARVERIRVSFDKKPGIFLIPSSARGHGADDDFRRNGYRSLNGGH